MTTVLVPKLPIPFLLFGWLWSLPWWHNQMETFSALLALCAGNSPVTSEFPTQRPVTRSFDVFFDLRVKKRFSKQSWGWFFKIFLRWEILYCHKQHPKAYTEFTQPYDKILIKYNHWYRLSCKKRMNIHKWQQKTTTYVCFYWNGLCNFNNIFHWIWLFNFDLNTMTMPYHEVIWDTIELIMTSL